MSASVSQPSATGSRSRPQARKKVNDDASYFGPPSSTSATAGTKRQAADKADGEPVRAKRKRVEPAPMPVSSKKDAPEAEQKASMVEFNKMPISVLYRYLTQFEIVPPVYPSPLSADDPPSPTSLGAPAPFMARPSSPPVPTPANRPRRESKEQSRRRSSRLLEEEIHTRTPVLADIEELHTVLAGIVEQHFREMTSISGREEVDTLASFMCAVEKAKGVKAKS